VHYLQGESHPANGDEFLGRMQGVGDSFRQAGVAAVYLAHGTFIGPDGMGLLADLSRVAPDSAELLRRWSKQLVDSVAGDLGNFTRQYANTWQTAMERPGTPSIPVRLFYWSSENNHSGRADAAVRLLNEFFTQSFSEGSRVLVLGHSHGGNALALLTNLLGSDRDARQEFFHVARNLYSIPILRRIDLPVWERVRQRLCAEDHPLPHLRIDVATLGTPVRYGWDTAGCDHLLHFINHRPVAGRPRYRADFPPSQDELWTAAHGDFVQQFGIAGTNLVPPLWALRTLDAEVRLGRFLQPDYSPRNLLARLRLGVRVHEDGENLLIDYGPGPGTPAQHLLGHAVYTRLEWLLFHAEQIAQRMYQHGQCG
jgi:hypothetical protein